MNIKSDALDLKVYGFEKLDKDSEPFDEDCGLSFLSIDSYKWCLYLGSSRRGQEYYILVNNDCELSVVATKPDGDGGAVPMPDVLLQMFLDGVIV